MKKAIPSLAVLLAVSCVCAATLDPSLQNVWLRGVTDKNALLYKPGEEMKFTIEMLGATNAIPENAWELWLQRTGDDGKKEEFSLPLPLKDGKLVYKTKLDCSGFVRVYAQVFAAGRKFVPRTGKAWTGGRICFDGGAGVNVHTLQGLPEPDDFDKFWAKRRARLDALPIKADVKAVSSNENAVCHAVSVNCAGGRPSTFYMSVPVKCLQGGEKVPALVTFWGYSDARKPSRSGLDADRILVDFNPHGFELEREEEYYSEFYRSIASGRSNPAVTNAKYPASYAFDYEKNMNADTAYFAGMSWRLLRALQYVKSTPWWNGRDLSVKGGSQGGLQSIWAAGLDKDVTDCESVVTWCCDFGGTKFNRLRGGWYIRHTRALDYYDPVNVAKRIPKTCRVTISRAGLGDYTCPPSGLACLYNSITAPKKIVWYQGSEHGYVAPPVPDETFTFESGAGEGPVTFEKPICDAEIDMAAAPRDPAEKKADAPSGMKLVLLVGQSNMAGRADVPPEYRRPLKGAFKLNRDDEWVEATSPLHFDRSFAGVGPGDEFVRRYLADHPGETVGIVPCAVGGSRLATWDPDGAGRSGANFRRALQRVKKAGEKGDFIAILWHQGESDATARRFEENRVYYPERFAAMAAAFRRETGDVPVLIGEIGRFLAVNAELMNPILNALPASVPRSACVSSEGLTDKGDKIHFSFNGAKGLGARYYEAYRKMEKRATGRKDG
ncbi:MAG: acetylxylan esterase [Kiritimatiellae bacterium]|nr:acetylxylan esterase [Kiritimatiellia bacterium]